MEIQLPHITATDTKGQLRELHRYLVSLSTTLRLALEEGGGTPKGGASLPTPSPVSSPDTARDTFNAIKSLIITSADIVDAYCEETKRRLSGHFAAESEFGSFREQTEQRVSETAARTDRLFENVQELCTELAGLESALLSVSARIRTGLLYYDEEGAPVYGLEVGQRNVVDGEETFHKYARFTADRLSFYDRNGTEVAFISDYQLVITAATIASDLKIGGYRIQTSNGIAFKWEGGLT